MRPRKLARRPQNRRTRPTQRSELEEGLVLQLRAAGIEGAIREFRFCAHHVGLGPGIRARLAEAGLKNWRFDFAWPGVKLAVECEGGGWVQGGHNRGEGFQDDLLKYHCAARLGWFVYRCDASLINSGKSLAFIEQYLEEHGGEDGRGR